MNIFQKKIISIPFSLSSNEQSTAIFESNSYLLQSIHCFVTLRCVVSKISFICIGLLQHSNSVSLDYSIPLIFELYLVQIEKTK